MKLSIIIIFCDKDYFCIPNLVETIQRDVKINKEIILLDNREHKKNSLINTHGVVVHSMGGNVHQFEARRKAIEYVTGDYMWFVDADDLTLPITTDAYFKDNKDFYYFDFGMANYSDEFKKNCVMIGDVSQNRAKYSALWNLFIKVDLWKKFIDKIPSNLVFKAGEDVLYYHLILKYAKSYGYIQNSFYVCIALENCNSAGILHEKSYEWFAQLFQNQKELHDLYQTLFSEKDFKKIGILKNYPFEDSHFHSYIKGRLKCVKDDDKKKCIKWLKKEYKVEICQ